MKPYYQDDAVTIYHADCRDVPELNADLLLADPPYGVRLDTTRRVGTNARFAKGGVRRSSNWPVMIGDDGPFDPSPWLRYPRVILWGANHYAHQLPPSAAWLVWDKREGTTSDDGADCEMAWTNLRGQARLHRQLWRGMLRRGEENGKRRVHPTQKPLALMAWCIERAQLGSGSLIFDPFMGSGTTLLAAKRAGHRAIGIEIEERYCEIAAARCAQEVLGLTA